MTDQAGTTLLESNHKFLMKWFSFFLGSSWALCSWFFMLKQSIVRKTDLCCRHILLLQHACNRSKSVWALLDSRGSRHHQTSLSSSPVFVPVLRFTQPENFLLTRALSSFSNSYWKRKRESKWKQEWDYNANGMPKGLRSFYIWIDKIFEGERCNGIMDDLQLQCIETIWTWRDCFMRFGPKPKRKWKWKWFLFSFSSPEYGSFHMESNGIQWFWLAQMIMWPQAVLWWWQIKKQPHQNPKGENGRSSLWRSLKKWHFWRLSSCFHDVWYVAFMSSDMLLFCTLFVPVLRRHQASITWRHENDFCVDSDLVNQEQSSRLSFSFGEQLKPLTRSSFDQHDINKNNNDSNKQTKREEQTLMKVHGWPGALTLFELPMLDSSFSLFISCTKVNIFTFRQRNRNTLPIWQSYTFIAVPLTLMVLGKSFVSSIQPACFSLMSLTAWRQVPECKSFLLASSSRMLFHQYPLSFLLCLALCLLSLWDCHRCSHRSPAASSTWPIEQQSQKRSRQSDSLRSHLPHRRWWWRST